jgi:hypothetical protein
MLTHQTTTRCPGACTRLVDITVRNLAARAAAGMVHQQPALQVVSLTPDQLPGVSRLHRFSSTEGGSVFGARDLSEVLDAAAGQQDG